MNTFFAAGWRQVGASLVLMATSAMVASTYGIVSVPLAQEFQASRMVLMLAMTILSGASAILSPLLGSLMDRVSLRVLASFLLPLLLAAMLVVIFGPLHRWLMRRFSWPDWMAALVTTLFVLLIVLVPLLLLVARAGGEAAPLPPLARHRVEQVGRGIAVQGQHLVP